MVESCSSSSQALYRSFPYKHEKLTHSAVPPLPKKSVDFSGSPFSLFVFADFSSSRIWRWTMFWKNDKTKRADYTEHQESAGVSLSLQSDVLCNRLWRSKSGSAFCNSRQQNQRRGGAVCYFQCTDTVSDESDFHKICLNILIQFLCADTIPRYNYTDSDTCYQYLHRKSLPSWLYLFLWTGTASLFAVAPWLPYSGDTAHA